MAEGDDGDDATERHDRSRGEATDLAFLADGYRKTVVTEVAAVDGPRVRLPRTVHYAPSTRYGHAAPSDRGHLLVAGHKLKLQKVAWRRGALVHEVRGPPPPVGAKVVAHLDWDRRHLAMRAHAAAHLIAHAVVAERRGACVAGPVTKGGGSVVATLALTDATPAGLAAVVKRVNELVSASLPVTSKWLARTDAARVATPQHVALADVAPGEPTLRVVATGDVARVPCDAPALKHTREIGRVVASNVLKRSDGWRVVFRILEAA